MDSKKETVSDAILRNEIAEIIKNGVTYSGQTKSVVIHGAIDEILKLIHRQEDLAVDICESIFNSQSPATIK